MQGIRITGVGSYIPERVVKNSEFEKFIETTDEWITSRTGIKERRFSTDKLNFEMAAEASLAAVKDAGKDVLDIDLIICSSCSPDFLYPSCSCLIQNLIGARLS